MFLKQKSTHISKDKILKNTLEHSFYSALKTKYRKGY